MARWPRRPPDLVRIVHATRTRPSHERVIAHADLGAEHILEVDGTLTGIIDWSDAAITDPALDLARLYRDFGPRFLEALLQAYGPLRHAMPRVKFFARCAALEDLALRPSHGAPRICGERPAQLRVALPIEGRRHGQ